MRSFIWWPASWHDCVWCARTMCFHQTWKSAKKLRIFQSFDFFFKNCMKSIGTSKMKFKDSCTTLLCPERSTMLEILMKNLWCKKIILNFIILWKPSKVISPISTTQLFSSLPEIGRHWGQEDMKRQTRPGRNGRCGHLRGHIGLILGPSGPNSPREGCEQWASYNFWKVVFCDYIPIPKLRTRWASIY